jgi:hypothetical protein
MNIPSTNAQRGKSRILLLLLCLFLLLASGRMDSGDANAELAGSVNLVETRGLGTGVPYSDELIQSLFVQAPNGRYYEAHDMGNSLLLTPAALGGVASSSLVRSASGATRPGGEAPLRTLIAKTLASLIETIVSAVGCFYLFLLFGSFYKARPALILTALFVFATFYTAYFRSAWDVVPACNAVIILLYYSAKLVLAPTARASEAVPVALWFGIVCLFRLSLAPFLGLGLLVILWGVRRKVTRNAVLAAFSVALLLFVPTLIFNAIRTGSPIRPANSLPQFQYQTSLSGSLLKGMFGLLLSPGHGLFIYSPILLLLVLLPWYWKSMPDVVRALLKAFLPAAFLYYLLMSKLLNWGAAGWGPRYLLPVLPILFLGAGAIAYQLWSQSGVRRLLPVSLCSIALLLSIATLLVDHSHAVLQNPEAFSGTTAYPIPHIAVWENLFTGLRGQALETRPDLGADEVSKLSTVFPDLLVARVYHVLVVRSKAAAEALLLLYVCTLGCTAYLLWSSVNQREALSQDEGGFHRSTPLPEEANAH